MYLKSQILVTTLALLFSSTALAHYPSADHSKNDHYHPNKTATEVAKKPQAAASTGTEAKKEVKKENIRLEKSF